MTERARIASIHRVSGADIRTDQDLVAVEAPLVLEIRRATRTADVRSLGVLMRTPGHDEELALGLLHGEGIVRRRVEVAAVHHLHRDAPSADADGTDVVQVDLVDDAGFEHAGARAMNSTSACGLCGRLEVQSLASLGAAATDTPAVTAPLITSLPGALGSGQSVFAETGGLHAAGLFDAAGRSLVIREDVGRHNAVDKVIGWALGAGLLPARDTILAVSGRVAFEIVQKAVMAGIPVIVAVGAPSSLAVEAARAARLTLVGFVRGDRFNVYTGSARLR